MNNSRDLALIIVFAVLGFVFMILIGQVPRLITGIPGITYIFTVVYSILQTVSWLLYEGRRWRIFIQGLLLALLALLFIPPWTLPIALATIINMFIVDLIFNSLYRFFHRNKRLNWLSILVQVYYWTTHSLWIVLVAFLFLSPLEEILEEWFIPIMSLMLPIMIIEAIAGAYIGY
ncbi:MAG: hypothetical protein ACFFCW_41720, partial [Candidatus Hodarchaeota archaeon]